MPVIVIVAAALVVNVTEQVPAERVQVVELKLPSPDGDALKVTVPVGVVLPLPPVSATVTVHVETWLIRRLDGEHDTVVLVVLLAVLKVVEPMLVKWSPSPP